MDATTQAVLNSQSISGFNNGVYLVWNISGHVTVSVNEIGGPNAVVSGVFFGGSSTITATASFVQADPNTQSNWHGVYGADGYAVANDSQSIPSYATLAIQNQSGFTYSSESTDVRALQTGSGVGRIAATWYNDPSFSFDVNFSDGTSHQFALYAMDWDSLGRAETIQVLDAATEAVLNTQNISGLTNGLYLVWTISGHVKINVIGTGGPNAVVSGIFFGGSSAITSSTSFVRSDTTTQGNWHGMYGVDGYSVASDSQNVPSYATFAMQNQATWTYSSETTNIKALETGSGVGRVAAVWYNSANFSFDVNFTDGNSHQFALYAIDWDNLGRAESIQVIDAATEAVLDTRSISAFTNGIYLVWKFSGHVKINVIATAGPNAVVSGVFFGGSSTITATASFVRSDASAQGNWHGAYGADGYAVANDSQSLPTYASFAIQNQAAWTWDAEPTDVRALQTGGGVGRIAATWYNSPSFTFDVNLTDGQSHPIALYAIDWDSLGRAESVQVVDAGTEAVLDTENMSGFVSGIYLVWNISGHVRINVIGTAGPNAVVSGMFFGGSSPITATASFVKSDATTEGAWPGAYGADGYALAGDAQSVPSYATFAIQNQSGFTWAANSSDPRALQMPGGSGAIAATWYNSPSFSFDINLTGGNAHQIALYALDWDDSGRTETIQVLDATTEAVLNTQAISSFVNGVYLVWNISGHVRINMLQTGAENAVISGVFFDPTTTGGTTGPPAITGLSPNAAAVGIPIAISGSNFGNTQGTSTITFNGVPAVPTSWSTSSIVVPVPGGATSGPLAITVNGQQVSASFQVLSVYLSSVYPQIAGVGSTVTLTGEGFGVSQGSGTATIGGVPLFAITWTDSQIVGVIQPNTTSGVVQVTQGNATSNALNLVVASPTVTQVAPTSGAPGTQVTLSGSGFGVSQGSGNVLLGSIFGRIVTWSDSQIVASVAPGSTSGTAQVLQGGVASNSVSFTVSGSGPTISSVSPSTAQAGSQVTVNGSGFGASQGASKVLLGTTFGSVQSWSDGQIVATVATGSSSGSVEVFEGLVTSNAVPFNVVTPNIVSISPTIGPAGTQVTISGSGFGASQGSGNAWLGTGYGSVVSWSDSQVVATVVLGSGSGYAQILQNGVWSNSIPFSTGTPNISGVSPNSGTSGTQITISGSGFGSSAGTLQLGTQPGIVSSWSDSQIVATVSTNSMTGIVQVQQGGLSSNSLRFIVPTSGNGNAVTLTPSLINLLVGQTRTIQALSPSGTEVAGLTWTSSDPTIVSLSTDDPPLMTALAPGHITITAGDSSCDVTVWSGSALPLGTVVWSAPGDGSGVTSIIPAVPSPTGAADTFAVQASGSVQALRADGTVSWTANVGTAYTSLNADFQGGLVAGSPTTITKYDGSTGQQKSQYTYNNPGSYSQVFLGADGTIFAIDGGSVVGIDPTSGATKFSVAMQQGSFSRLLTCETQLSQSGNSPPAVGLAALAGDGYLYVYYQYSNSFSQDVPVCNGSVGSNTTTQALLRVGPGGDHTTITLGSFTSSGQVAYFTGEQNTQYFIETQSQSGIALQITSMITNANQGIFATWSTPGTNAYCAQEVDYINPPAGAQQPTGCVPALPGQSGVMTISASGISGQITSADGYSATLQNSSGNFYGSTNEGTLSAFDSTGNVRWSASGYYAQMTTADGGVIGQSADRSSTITFDANGNVTGQLASLPTISWSGESYSSADGTVSDLWLAPPAVDPTSYWAIVGGGPSQNGTPTPLCPCEFQEAQGGSSASHRGSEFLNRWDRATPQVRTFSLVRDDTAVESFNMPHLVTTSYHAAPFGFRLLPGSFGRRFLPRQSGSGSGSTYLILIGQPDGNGGLFDLGAGTAARCLQATFTAIQCLPLTGGVPLQGYGNPANIVTIPSRISSVTSFEEELIGNGIITGGLFYYGHGFAYRHQPNSGLNPGGTDDPESLVTLSNVSALTNQTLGPNAYITLKACHAGWRLQGGASIAQAMANTLQRTVLAWKVGSFFSQHQDAVNIYTYVQPNGRSEQISGTTQSPVYLIPWGCITIAPCVFAPNQPEPNACVATSRFP